MAFGVICEFNPFHNGHKHLLEMCKNDGEAAVAIMSGSFTQRGDAAITDKFSRAGAALKNGADLVIELPTVCALGGAETFARGGIEIATALGVVNKLCFGAETADISALKKAAELFENEQFQSELKTLMSQGEYYPRAVQMAFESLAPELVEIVTQPNNTLALEYVKALKNSKIEPFAIERVGAHHDSGVIEGNIASASLLRKMIKNGEDVKDLAPDCDFKNFADIKNLERVILFRLRTMSKDEISNLPDIGEGLENRIIEAAKNSRSLDELFENIKTKRYTMARIRRVILCALLGITSEMSRSPIPCVRVLGFNQKGAELLGEIKQSCPLPLVVNVAADVKTLDEIARKIFDIDLRASDIFALATNEIGTCGKDFTHKVKVE